MPAAQRWQKTAKIPVVTGKCPSGRQKVLTCQNKLAVCNQVHGTVPTHASNTEPQACVCHFRPLGPTQRAKHASSPWGPWRRSRSEACGQDLSQMSKISKVPWGGNQHMHVVACGCGKWFWVHSLAGCIFFCMFLT